MVDNWSDSEDDCDIPNMKLATVLAVLWVSEASLKELRSRNKSKTISSSPDNICNLEPSHNDNIRCFCTKDKYHQVSSAECWIFGSVTKDNFMWKLIIESQPYLAEFSVISSKNGDLSSIPKYFSSRMLFLKNLTVTFGVIETIEKFAFGNSTSLQKLILAQNQIKYLDQFSISNLLSLTELDLSENNIKLIHPAVFLNVPQLKYVRLNKNNITKIEDKAFAGLGNVLDLDLSENLLCDINNMTFFGLSKLKVIDLSMNKIIGLTSSVFLELWDIEEMYLDDNNIEFISNRAFDGLRFLKTLSLKNNRLSRFPAGLFTSVFTLVHLDLSYNRLETLVFDSIEQFYNNLLHNGTIHLKVTTSEQNLSEIATPISEDTPDITNSSESKSYFPTPFPKVPKKKLKSKDKPSLEFQELLQKITNFTNNYNPKFPLDSQQFTDLLENIHGSSDTLSIAKHYTLHIPSLIEMINEIHSQTKDRNIKIVCRPLY
ncbi:unnamed protein product [Diabrotica balteata]|uniref:Uncharacterized protein n=1 Tax=Diabrotica balteata TaxID=107213 RepID=A0A9N9SYF5_DIABA|nr:unnamed protein product [Diabrotica balteata]